MCSKQYFLHHFLKIKDDSAIDDLVPSLSDYVQCLCYYKEQLLLCEDEESTVNIEKTLKELIAICSLLDFSDEIGRRSLSKFLSMLLSDLLIINLTNSLCVFFSAELLIETDLPGDGINEVVRLNLKLADDLNEYLRFAYIFFYNHLFKGHFANYFPLF